jgi:hypothetical protein
MARRVAFRRGLPIEQSQLGLLNEEQERVRPRLEWQRARRIHGAGHQVLLRLRPYKQTAVSGCEFLPSIAPPGQAAVKLVEDPVADHGRLQPNPRMQPTGRKGAELRSGGGAARLAVSQVWRGMDRVGAPPNPLMQPRNAGDAGRPSRLSLPAATKDRRLSQVVCS